ncbi:hypothetical protein ASG01_13060 [Chryseobacterium sp. Leaf180]|uniref:LIC_10190 family membrane protein n=1 Tax=Chryseobacterium sp. Leaf180 TaxID=1736289 RepID=UPI0006F56F0B|nr:hypothetical protein [Chryseobacterium sp. Leaf180]KQR91927.1 hypothetical protein ASG01_13060 [Chryseobacterium sp. Leaf180]
MLFILLSAVLIFPVLYGWGLLAERLLPEISSHFLSGTLLTGICFVTCIAAILAFFFPLNIYIEALVIAVGFTGLFLNRDKINFQNFDRKNLKIVFAGTLVTAFLSSFYPYILDHFGYYVSTVNWLDEFGFVKGISNLDLTLGQTSFWHILESVFSHILDPFLRLNAIFTILFLVYSIEKKSWLLLIFIPFFLLFVQSPSPDLAVMIISLIVVNEIFLKSTNITFLFALSVFAFAIKPTIFWLPVFTFVYVLIILKSSFKNLIPGTFILILMLIKNLYVFGYPIFPIAFFDLNLLWKPHPKLMEISSKFAVEKTFDNQFSTAEINKFTVLENIKNWLFIPGIKSVINILFIFALILFSIFTFIKKNKVISHLWISVIMKSIIILIISAQYRFFLDVFLIIFLTVFYSTISKSLALKISAVSSFLILIFFCFPKMISSAIPSYRMSEFMGKFEIKQLIKPSKYSYKAYQTFKVGNLTFHVSKNYPFNFDTPLPAISEGYLFDYQRTEIFPQMIDPNDISRGFVSKKMTSAEIRQLDEVIIILKSTARP